eukprot:351563-Chlamydomonas_euryale.AAC.3
MGHRSPFRATLIWYTYMWWCGTCDGREASEEAGKYGGEPWYAFWCRVGVALVMVGVGLPSPGEKQLRMPSYSFPMAP